MKTGNEKKPTIYNKFHTINNYLFQLLATERFYCARYDELNDPYDCRVQFSENFLEGMFNGDTDCYIRHDVDMNYIFKEAYFKFTGNQNDFELTTYEKMQFINEFYDKFICILLNHIGHNVVSFTVNEDKSDNDILMWAHYSASSRGVKLKFDFSDDPGNNILPFMQKVSYNPRVIVNKTKDLHEQIFNKTINWNYESEYRMISNKHKYITFERRHLKEIIFGYNVPENDIYAIMRTTYKIGYNCDYFQIRFIKGILEKIRLPYNPRHNEYFIDGKSIKRIDY